MTIEFCQSDGESNFCMLISELAARLGCQVIGDPATDVAGVAPIETATADDLTFFNNIRYKRHLASTAAKAIILQDEKLLPAGKVGLIAKDPYLTFARALRCFYPPKERPAGIHPTATVSPLAQLGQNVSVGAYVIIEDHAQIGDHVTIHPHCMIYENASIGAHSLLYSHCVVRENCVLGERVILQNHVTIGSDGFGFTKQEDGSWYKIVQAGNVVIESDVEIGAGSTVDRATIGTTIVHSGVKLDNLVHIGHGSSIGERTLLCAQVGMAGSTHIGKDVILAGQTGVAGHLTVGDGVFATAQTGIPSSVEPGRQIAGSPAMDKRDWLKTSGAILKLPQALKELRALREKLDALEAANESSFHSREFISAELSKIAESSNEHKD